MVDVINYESAKAGQEQSKQPNAFVAYIAIGIGSAIASILIAPIALINFSRISDSGIWAMAVMVLAPSFMAIGISFFIYKSSSIGKSA
jgi:hypothetical protein